MDNESLDKIIERFKKLSHDDYMGEENVKIKLIIPIFYKLGWNINYNIDFEHSIDGRRVDCCFIKSNKTVLLLDTKAHKKIRTLDDKCRDEEQLKKYCFGKKNPCGVITDGLRWELYGPFGKEEIDNISIKEINFSKVKDKNYYIKAFERFYFENIDYLQGNDTFILDKIWGEKSVVNIISDRLEYEILAKNSEANIPKVDLNDYVEQKINNIIQKEKNVLSCNYKGFNNLLEDTFSEVIGNDDENTGIVNVLTERLKYGLIAMGANIIDNKFNYKKYAEKKMREMISSPKVKNGKDISKIYEDTIGTIVNKESVDEIRRCVCSFWRNMGWNESNIEETPYGIALKNRDIAVCIIIIKVFEGKRSISKKIDDYKLLIKECRKCNTRYGVVTNGIRWEFYDLYEKEEKSCLFKEVELTDENRELIADFLSMFSIDKIDNLYQNVVGSRIFDCIFEEKKENADLYKKICDAIKVNASDEDIDSMIRTFRYKVLAKNPDIDISIDYLKKYIKRMRFISEKPKEDDGDKIIEKSGLLYVKFSDGKEICKQTSKETFVETIKRIGLEKVAKSGVINKKVPVVSKEYPYMASIKYGKKSIEEVDGYYIMAHGSVNTFISRIKDIKNSANLKEELTNLIVKKM